MVLIGPEFNLKKFNKMMILGLMIIIAVTKILFIAIRKNIV